MDAQTPITRRGSSTQNATGPGGGDRTDASLGSLPNGPGAASILAAGIGSLALGVLSFAGDASPVLLHAFSFWRPSGPLSGVTLCAVAVWLLAWYGFSRVWSARNVNLVRVNVAAFVMLIAGLLLTFPPLMDLLEGK